MYYAITLKVRLFLTNAYNLTLVYEGVSILEFYYQLKQYKWR